MISSGSRTGFGTALGGFAGVVALAALSYHGGGGALGSAAADVSEKAPPNVQEKLKDLLPNERGMVEVFQHVSPSVVNVSNLAQRRVSFWSFDLQEIPQGTGTGFIWDKQGHVITNFHVIASADAVSVNFADGTTRRAKVVGTYKSKDVAVLKIDYPSDKLVPIVPGTSSDLLVGQMVMAIGNPFGLDHTLTSGIVSALGREIRALDGYPIQDVIQTDASINPGNSGGPLLDSRGRLIGMNTAIYSPSGASAGIGFAIPVDTVKGIIEQIIEKGKVTRAGMGIELFQDQITARLHLEGALVARVAPRSAAAKAGLKGTQSDEEGEVILGDLITAIDGKKIASNDDLFKAMDRFKVGDTIQVTCTRGGKERKVEVKLQSID